MAEEDQRRRQQGVFGGAAELGAFLEVGAELAGGILEVVADNAGGIAEVVGGILGAALEGMSN